MLFGRSTENTRYYKQNIYFYNEITRDISGILQAIHTFFFQFLIHRQFNEKFMYVSSLLIFICAKKKCAKKIAFRSIQLKFSNVEKENFICNFYAPFASLCVMRLLESTQTMGDIYKDYQNV